jgi:hypothetical protein
VTDWRDPVDIGDLTVSRVPSPVDGCQHREIELIGAGEIVRCKSCGVQVGAFWALSQAHLQWRAAYAKLEARKAAIEQSFAQRLTFIAAKRVEKAWRQRGTVPACPHCKRGIMADDNLGAIRVKKQDELDQRQSDAARTDQEKAWSGER